MADKPEPRPTDEPHADETAKSFGEALREMGFLPVDPPRRITLRQDRPSNRLWRWRRPEGQGSSVSTRRSLTQEFSVGVLAGHCRACLRRRGQPDQAVQGRATAVIGNVCGWSASPLGTVDIGFRPGRPLHHGLEAHGPELPARLLDDLDRQILAAQGAFATQRSGHCRRWLATCA